MLPHLANELAGRRKHRHLTTQYLNYRAVDTYTHVLDFEADVLMKELFIQGNAGASPLNPQVCSFFFTEEALTLLTDSIKDELVKTALHLSCKFMNCTSPISNLVDFVPFLQKILTFMSSHGHHLHGGLMGTYGGLIKDIEVRMNCGEDVPDCLAKSMILAQEEEGLDDKDMAILASAFMIGGVETTAAIMQWFSAAYPEIQAKAHAELDCVIGQDCMPSIDDEKNLPYIHAIVKEVKRCHNPFWLGTPHFSTEDFRYNGYLILKDIMVVLNTYTMHNDPACHPEPETFNPDRYINNSTTSAESANLANANEQDHWMFGASHRICPGMIVAECEIWLTIAWMLWCFRMEAIPSEPIDLKEYNRLSGCSPMPFRIKCIPCDDNIAKVLEL
ncbi:hypothetical protein JAAARDRAFT_193457 [Jaapia argillacea MUCL 33604]|uniref:Cytochrome P450 n=1 Tax=Jaapia argillacea MUCL 33604 TaxID=933084 RepID=A0A067PT36_9AGAM|nr:hypothetical protein JAAARDRAFT_193457 [Jaapia argillacea MUCL 33604]